MRVRTSITLEKETLRALDRVARGSSRSQVIEEAVREYIARRERAARDARERALLDAHADVLNAEMAEVLEFQADWSNREAR